MPDSIRELEAASRDRRRDAESLAGDRSCWKVYTLGFAIEMLLKCAWYRRIGLVDNEPVTEWFRFARQWGEANGLQARAAMHGHDLFFWAQLLVLEAERSGQPLPSELSSRLVAESVAASGLWSERLRYRRSVSAVEEAELMRGTLQWIRQAYVALWS